MQDGFVNFCWNIVIVFQPLSRNQSVDFIFVSDAPHHVRRSDVMCKQDSFAPNKIRTGNLNICVSQSTHWAVGVGSDRSFDHFIIYKMSNVHHYYEVYNNIWHFLLNLWCQLVGSLGLFPMLIINWNNDIKIWPFQSWNFFLYSSSCRGLTVNLFIIKLYRWLDLNCGPLLSETTALPTRPQPQPNVNSVGSVLFSYRNNSPVFRGQFGYKNPHCSSNFVCSFCTHESHTFKKLLVIIVN